MRKIIAIALLFAFMVTACSFQNKNKTNGENTDGSKIGTEITDSDELQALWDEYLFDTITTVLNVSEFNPAESPDVGTIVRYGWLKYVREHGIEGLEKTAENNYSRYFPLETAEEYAKRYFELDYLRTAGLSADEFDNRKESFIFYAGEKDDRQLLEDFQKGNSFGLKLDKVFYSEEDELTVTFNRYSGEGKERVETTMTLVLRERADGSLYFISGIRKYIDNKMVTFTGNYIKYDRIEGYEGNVGELYLLGEKGDGSIILATRPEAVAENPALYLLSVGKEKLSVQRRHLFPPGKVEFRFRNGRILVLGEEEVFSFDLDLKQKGKAGLPQELKKVIAREPMYDENGLPLNFFGGYDVDAGLNLFVYSDENGLRVLTGDGRNDYLASATHRLPDDRLIDKSYHLRPRFVADGDKVLTIMSDYEGHRGYNIYSLTANKERYLCLNEDNLPDVDQDTGLVIVNSLARKQNGDYGFITRYFDFQSEEFTEIALKEKGAADTIYDYRMAYCGNPYVAFITTVPDAEDSARDKYYLNRLDLRSFVLEEKLLTVKAGRPTVMGILANGQVILDYEFNPSEKGYLIVD